MYLALIFAITVIILTYLWLRRPTNFPPGPVGLPIIGPIRTMPHLACQQISKEYGPTLGLKCGDKWRVVLHEAKAIREAFGDIAVTGRRVAEVFDFLLGDEYGIVQSSGDVWSDQRKFAIRTLRDFGFGKASMEEMILDEALELVDWLKKEGGAPVELKRRFSLAVGNSFWRIITGERYEHDDPALLNILDQVESSQKEVFTFATPLKKLLLFSLPTIAKMFPNYSGWTRLENTANSRAELFDKIIQTHIETFQAGNHRDFIDVYLEHMQNVPNKTAALNSTKAENLLRSVISDFFLAGTDTTAVTLMWTVLYLLNCPEVQEKIHSELSTVLVPGRHITLQDRKKLPYLECVIMECLRCSSIVPMGIPHVVLEDIMLDGYNIPKGTVVEANLYHVHHDPKIWGDPEVFRPERFMNPDGSCMGRHESLMPFSVGRRICMGESLARDSLFIFTALIVQNFTIVLPDGVSEKPSMTIGRRQLTLQPTEFKVSMKFRP